MTQEYLTTFEDSEQSTKESEDKPELGEWPEDLPEELQHEQYPPIESGQPLGDSPPLSNIYTGDADCYRAKIDGSTEYFGFLILDVKSSREVILYNLHMGHYTTVSIDGYSEYLDLDVNSEDSSETEKIKLYRDVA